MNRRTPPPPNTLPLELVLSRILRAEACREHARACLPEMRGAWFAAARMHLRAAREIRDGLRIELLS